MRRTRIGQSDLSVSRMCLGAMYFGSKLDEQRSFELLDHFHESGGDFVDTSNNYALWIDGCTGDESENTLGKWMESRGAKNRITIATKVGARPKSGGSGFDSAEGLSANSIELAIDGSLRRLGVDCIDLYYAHVTDKRADMSETLGAFDALVKKGKVKAIGCSNHRAFEIERAKQVARTLGLQSYSAVQQRHSFLRPKPFSQFVGGVQVAANEDLLEYCSISPEISLLAYSPLLGGLYGNTGKGIPVEYDNEENRSDLARLIEFAKTKNATPNQVVLSWMMNGRNKIIPIIAASTIEQLKENIAAEKITMTIDEVKTVGWWGSGES